ncbi:MAG: DUF3868 domain-containing protein [Muribaculaceae bacterium]|nr:DUF3868 domain-containing protein [Muribaculaceae bacterium]
MNKKIAGAIISAAVAAVPVFGREIVDNVSVDSLRMEREGSHLSVSMNLGIGFLPVPSGRGVVLSPWLVNGNDSVALPPVSVYGRRRYIYEKRNAPAAESPEKDRLAFMAKKKPEVVAYREFIPYSGWMDGAALVLHREDRGCCRSVLLRDRGVAGVFSEAFFPELVYVKPEGEREKRRSLEGKAYIDFPVDQTVIYPDYRRNTAELAAIRATIDTIRDDRDARIDTVWLKGFASPESPYAHNTDLAKGRTEALRQYIRQLYDFDNVAILTDYEPEDWDGLREAVEKSNLDHRDGILELIGAELEPDAKEARIKKLYPTDYAFMLQHFYPALRHTNYKVSYVIRTYNDPVEILEVMRSHPQNLDLNEFYVAAAEFEPGSDEFTEVFETAVRMYPDDEAANLNAANAAIRRGDLAAAMRYLDKAGDSAEALYAKGAVAVREKDFATARRYLSKAAAAGLDQASATLDELEKRNSYTTK